MSIGARFHELRKHLGIGQIEFARTLGVSQSGLVAYEKGEREPPAIAIVAACKAHRASPEWLLLGHGAMFEQDIFKHLDDAIQATKIVLPRYRARVDDEIERRMIVTLFKYLIKHGTIDDDMSDTLFRAVAGNE